MVKRVGKPRLIHRPPYGRPENAFLNHSKKPARAPGAARTKGARTEKTSRRRLCQWRRPSRTRCLNRAERNRFTAASLSDTAFLKPYLAGLSWSPTDLSCGRFHLCLPHPARYLRTPTLRGQPPRLVQDSVEALLAETRSRHLQTSSGTMHRASPATALLARASAFPWSTKVVLSLPLYRQRRFRRPRGTSYSLVGTPVRLAHRPSLQQDTRIAFQLLHLDQSSILFAKDPLIKCVSIARPLRDYNRQAEYEICVVLL
jgi:hypothetical protein